jgi:ketosteroid isomerase-like protein
MRLSSRTLWLTVPLVVLFGCAEEPATEEAAVATEEVATAEPEVDPAAVRSEIETVNRQFVDALNSGDFAGASRVYTEDARILPPDMAPTEGRQNIEQFWAGGVQQLGIRDVQLTTDELEVSGETAYEQGRYQFNTNQGPAQGKYVVIWKRTPEGWRWHRDIWNPSPAA